MRAYGYDAVDQLTGETLSQGGQTLTQSTLSYDPMGNRTGAQSTSTTTQSTSSYTNNKLNQLIALSTTTGTDTSQSTLGYDQSGNLTGVSNGTSGTSYSYDDANRLSAVEVAGQSKSTFLYDGMSRLRVSRDFAWQNGAWVQTGEVRRVYDGMNVVQERDAQNNVLTTYTRGTDMGGGIGGLLARSDGNGSLFYHYDGRGNVTQLTNSTQQVVAKYGYDAFGNTSATGTAAGLNRYRFSTKEQIGGLYAYGYRFYSTELGRWINRDPIAEEGGVNLYAAVGNNPVNGVDLWGLKDWSAEEVDNWLAVVRIADRPGSTLASVNPWDSIYWNAVGNHGHNGMFDFKNLYGSDRFCVEGRWFSAADFGNYVAGYGGYISNGELGVEGVLAGGDMYEGINWFAQQRDPSIDYGNWGYPWDDPEGKDLINLGAQRAREYEMNCTP